MGTAEVKVEKVPWLLVLVTTIVLAFIGPMWEAILPGSLNSAYDLGIVLCSMELTSAPFILMLLAAPFVLAKSTRGRINMKTLTYLYVVGIVTSYFLSTHWPFNIPNRFWMDRHMYPLDSQEFVPWFMAPPGEITEQLTLGGVPIPWGDWIPSLLYWWIQQILMGIFMLSIATIFRRQYIDIEKVPFPQTMAVFEIMKPIAIDYEQPSRAKRIFLIGVIAGFALQIPIYLQSVFPWFPDIYGWRTNTCPTGAGYVTPDSPFAGIAGIAEWNKQPLAVAIGYMMPLSVLLNTWFWYLILVVLAQVAQMMGYYTGIESTPGCCRGWGHPSTLNDPPYKFHVMTYVGGAVGLAVFYLFLSRNYIISTIKAAFGGPSVSQELEKGEPVPYRTSYAMFIGSLLLLIIFWLITGLSLLSSIIMMFTIFIFWLAFSRVYGLAGMHLRSDSYGMIFYKPIWPTIPETRTRDFVLSVIFVRTMGIDTPSYGWGGNLFGSFGSYRMASLTGVSNKNIFKTLMAVMVIVPIVTLLAAITIGYGFGTRVWFQNRGYGDGIISHLASAWYYNEQPAAGSLTEPLVVGFIIAGVLSILHARFVWFPFEPIGWILGWSYSSILFGYWLPFLIAWVIKFATLRIGGSKAYESTGLPLFGGIAGGCMLGILVGGVVSVIRFFVPF